MAPAAKGRKAGKENAPLSKSKIVEADADSSFGDMSMEETPAKGNTAKATVRGGKGTDTADEKAGSSSDAARKLAAVTADRDRLREQRDEVSKQFEDLSRLRNTESEKLFERYKEVSETAGKAQNDIIANLTTLNEKQVARIASLEKSLAAALKNAESASNAAAPESATAPAPAPAPAASTSTLSKSEQKELKSLREEVTQLRTGNKEKESKIAQLEQEYKAEVAHSQSLLQQSTRTAPNLAASTSHQSEEAEKDAISLAFYEDMTELQIVNVKIKRDGKNGKEATLNCLHTNQEHSRTLQFKIRIYQEISPELRAAKAENPWVRMIHYQPESLASETDKEFVKRLQVFADEFTIERKQVTQMWDDLRTKVAGEEDGEDDEE